MKTSVTGSRKTADASRGFTLIELLVVMVIIALMAGLTVSMFGTEHNSGREAASRLLEAAASARAQARLSKRPVALALFPGGFTLPEPDGTRRQWIAFPEGVTVESINARSARPDKFSPEHDEDPGPVTDPSGSSQAYRDSDPDRGTPLAALVFQPRGVTRATAIVLRRGTEVYTVFIPSIGTGTLFTEEIPLERIIKEHS